MGYTNLVKGLRNCLVWCDKHLQAVAATQGEKSLLKPGGEPMPHSNSHSHSAPRAYPTPFVLFILAIVLTIATIFTEIFDLYSREFCGFNDVFNDLDDDFELEKSGLNHTEYDLCEVLSSPLFDTVDAAAYTSAPVFNLRPKVVGLTGFGDLECYLIDVLLAPAVVTNENEIEIRFDSGCTLLGQCTQSQTQHTTAAGSYTVSPANDNENEIKVKIDNDNLQFIFLLFETLDEMHVFCGNGSGRSSSYNFRSSRMSYSR